jgi:hypothetical protein
MRKQIKFVSSKAQKFIPKGHETFDENAKEIQERPMVIMARPMNREDRYNIQSLMEIKRNGEEASVSNLGTVARYLWDNCVLEVRNVVREDASLEVVKGAEKNQIFGAQGCEEEVAQAIAWIQEISRLNEDEVKN